MSSATASAITSGGVFWDCETLSLQAGLLKQGVPTLEPWLVTQPPLGQARCLSERAERDMPVALACKLRESADDLRLVHAGEDVLGLNE